MRRALAGVWAILALGVLLVLLAALPAPERVPTHWSGSTPDGWSTGVGFTSALLTTTVLCTVLAAAVPVLRHMLPAAWGRWIVTGAAAVGWTAVLMYAVIVWRVAVDGPDAVREWWALLPFVGGLLAGWLAHAVHGRRVPSAQELADLVPERARVRPVPDRAARPVQPWGTDISSTTLRVIGWGVLALFAVAGVVVRLAGESWAVVLVVAVTGLMAGALALVWSVVRVEVDATGLRVGSALVPVRLARIPVESVAGVDVQDLDPMRWGGVGLRVLPDRTAYIVEGGGPGIVVYRRDGRRLALQITEGDQAARVGARTLLQAAGQRVGEAAS